MGWFSNDNNNDRRKREIEYELRDLRSEKDSVYREMRHAGDMAYSCKFEKDHQKELSYWCRVEGDLARKDYLLNKAIQDLEYELRRL